MRLSCLTVLAGLTLGGCAQAEPVALAEAAPQTRAELISKALLSAADAAQNGDKAKLTRAMRIVDGSGARPLEGSSEDPVPEWRAAAGNEEPPMRGRPLGPGYRSGKIMGGGRDSFAQLFLSGTSSTIALSSPNGDRVALNVLDQDAKQVCQRQAAQSGACRWVPLFTQRYTIEVRNLGESDARYFLVIE